MWSTVNMMCPSQSNQKAEVDAMKKHLENEEVKWKDQLAAFKRELEERNGVIKHLEANFEEAKQKVPNFLLSCFFFLPFV